MEHITVRKSAFGTLPNGTEIELYTLRNSRGMEARIATYGGALVSFKTPDKNGNFGDIVLGYESVDSYFQGKHFFGGLIGRCGNRIAGGRFSIDGRAYQVTVNNWPEQFAWRAESFRPEWCGGQQHGARREARRCSWIIWRRTARKVIPAIFR